MASASQAQSPAKEQYTDMCSVFESGVFIFEVGPEKKRFYLHKKAVEEHSPVLANMMNNGKMQESETGIASLEHVRPETFRLGAEFVYTGIYRIEATQQAVQEATQNSTPLQTKMISKKYNRMKRTMFDISCQECGYQIRASYTKPPLTCNMCCSLHVNVKAVEDGSNIIQNPNLYYQRLESVNGFSNNPTASSKTAFQVLSYPVLDKSHDDYAQFLRNLYPPDQVTEKVSHHAMLFVFAQMYMMEPLARICLHKLHRDLLAMKITADNVTEINELLTYSYENSTSMEKDENKTRTSTEDDLGAALRCLVITYAVTNAKTLSQFPSFQTMLQAGGELVRDYLSGITKRLMD